jgi:hypothetical protein
LHFFRKMPDKLVAPGEDGAGFITLENIFIRLNTTFAPEGSFSRLSDVSIPDVNGEPTSIGFDAAVCLELYEPWVVELYNSSVAYPNSLRIVDKAAAMTVQQRAKKTLAIDPSVQRQLFSSNYPTVYVLFCLAMQFHYIVTQVYDRSPE